jgi:hypothetical protein
VWCLKQLDTGLSPRKPRFAPGSVHVGFMVDKVTLGQVFLEFFGFPLSKSFQHCSILIYHRTKRCVSALTKQRIIPRASALIRQCLGSGASGPWLEVNWENVNKDTESDLFKSIYQLFIKLSSLCRYLCEPKNLINFPASIIIWSEAFAAIGLNKSSSGNHLTRLIARQDHYYS